MNTPARRCLNCHHGRRDAVSALGPYWCALQRLADPEGRRIVHHAAGDYAFRAGQAVAWSVSRSRSPGPVEGFSVDFRSGQPVPLDWRGCDEFSPRVAA